MTSSAGSVLDLFLEYTAGLPSPEIFRRWAAISLISGALERRVWAHVMNDYLYPNLWVLLVGGPGIGKSMSINPVRDLWAAAGKFNVAPSSLTRAAFVDTLKERPKMQQKTGEMHHTLLIGAPEFGVLVPAHDLEFLNTLNDIYDCRKLYEARTRTAGTIRIEYPHLMMLSGTQPKYLGETLPEAAWGLGFTSRMLMIYSADKVKVSLFKTQTMNQERRQELIEEVKRLEKLSGEFTWSPEAQDLVEQWHLNGGEPEPTHSKLQSYNPRRITHVIKLAMIFSAARSSDLFIELCDVKEAMSTLFEAEALMPEIFKDIQGDNDAEVLDEAYEYVRQQYMKSKKPVREGLLFNELTRRVTLQKIDWVINAMLRANMIKQTGDLNLPVGSRLFEPCMKPKGVPDV